MHGSIGDERKPGDSRPRRATPGASRLPDQNLAASCRSRSSTTSSSTRNDWIQTAGTPCSASRSSDLGWRSILRLRRKPHWVSKPNMRLRAEVFSGTR